MKTGVVSVTFRPLKPAEIIALTKQAGLQSIEWGGDVHVPPGETGLAREVAAQTRSAGLEVAGYGSYFMLGSGGEFGPVIETAIALQAPVIRLWAGKIASADILPEARAAMAAELHGCAVAAAGRGITLSLEHHQGTAADHAGSAANLIDAAGLPAVRTHWQPLTQHDDTWQFRSFERLRDHVLHLHVFWRNASTNAWLPLSEGRSFWEKLLAEARTAPHAGAALIEFVKDGTPEQFLADAQVLRKMVERVVPNALD